MMIDPKRIEAGLTPSGFRLAYFDSATLAVVFFRRRNDELFERIAIGQGRQRGQEWGQIVDAGVEATIVPGRTALKGMAEVACIMEVASDSRGSTSLEAPEDARRWEDALIKAGPPRAKAFADEVGPSLLESTKVQRESVKRYGELIGFDHNPQQLVQELNDRATPRQRSEVDRILKTPIVWIFGGRIYYELAALTIALCAAEVKGNPEWFWGIDPAQSTDRRLMIELQILASRFAHEPGW
jgi:hypothetical protein